MTIQRIVRLAFVATFLTALIFISACSNPNQPSPTNPSPTGQVQIPAPDMAHLENAWVRYHRAGDKAVYAPNADSEPSALAFTYLAPGAREGERQDLNRCSAGTWDQQEKILTCLASLGMFPTDVEIQVKASDPAVFTGAQFSGNAGRDIYINKVKIPSRVTSNGEEGYFKLRPDGSVYW